MCHGVECSCQSPPSSASSDDFHPPETIQSHLGGLLWHLEVTENGGVAAIYAERVLHAITCWATRTTKDLCAEILSSMEYAIAVVAFLELEEKDKTLSATQPQQTLSLEETAELGNAGRLRNILTLNLRPLLTRLFTCEDLIGSNYDLRVDDQSGWLHKEGYEAIIGNVYIPEIYRTKLRISILKVCFPERWNEEN
jgi:hypothetical protein